jgi:phage-related tail protein
VETNEESATHLTKHFQSNNQPQIATLTKMTDNSKPADQQASGILGGLTGVLGGVTKTAGGVVGGVLNTVGDTVGTVGKGVGDTLTSATTGLGDTTKNLGGAVENSSSKLAGDARNKEGELKKWVERESERGRKVRTLWLRWVVDDKAWVEMTINWHSGLSVLYYYYEGDEYVGSCEWFVW